MLQNLQADWEERESRRGDGTQSFFEWFKNNKVMHYNLLLIRQGTQN